MTADPRAATRHGVVADIGSGRLLGIGTLPHRDADAAAAFSIGEYDIATAPALPQRSSAEGLLAQAVGGVPGLDVDASGGLVVEGDVLDVRASTPVDLTSDRFVGLRAFVDLAAAIGHDGKPIKWQFVGPVTLGAALARAGVETPAAFELALRTVRDHVSAIGGFVRSELPASEQIVVLDEPSLTDLMAPDFPIAPDEADDLISSAMAAADQTRDVVGVHCCGPSDLAMLLASGPRLISIPVDPGVVDYAGYLARFLDDGGIIAWGVVPTDRPVGPSSDRYWKALADTWCSLVERGVDATMLRRQALITPTCGFGAHQVSMARRLTRLTGEVARKVKDQAAATRFALGA